MHDIEVPLRSAATPSQAQFECIVCGGRIGQMRYPVDTVYAESTAGMTLERPVPQVWECTDCGHHCIHPEPKANFLRAFYARYMTQAIHGFYESRRADEIARAFHDRYGRILEMLPPHVGDACRLLDIGSGAGMFLRLAHQRGFLVEGIEPNKHAADHVARTYGIKVHVTFLEDFSSTQAYDVVTLWDLLEHLRNPRAALAKVQALLQPNGAVIIECPVRDSLLSGFARAIYRLTAGKVRRPLFLIFGVHHLHYFSSAGLMRLLSETGFTVTRQIRFETDLSSLKRKAGAGLINGFKAVAYNFALSALFILARMSGSQNKIVAIARRQGTP